MGVMIRHTQTPPFLFLNGHSLYCGEPLPVSCWWIWTPNGNQPLPQRGDLVVVSCSMLPKPKPRTCAAASAAASTPPPPQPKQNCTNCVEVGTFRWQPQHQTVPSALQCILVTAGVAACEVVLGRAVWRLSLWQCSDVLYGHLPHQSTDRSAHRMAC